MREGLRIAELVGDLDSAGRRRFWLLHLLIQTNAPTEALRQADRLAKFIDGREAGNDVVVRCEPRDEGTSAAMRSLTQLEQTFVRGEVEISEGRGSAASQTKKHQLDLPSRISPPRRFHNDKHACPLEPVRRSTAALNTPAQALEEAREHELRMQEEFLRRKPKAAPTLDDVIRFLRQRGDVVLRSGEKFTVNFALSLTRDELIERANRKRREIGSPPFDATEVIEDRPAVTVAPRSRGVRRLSQPSAICQRLRGPGAI